jgi:hypothetical protein
MGSSSKVILVGAMSLIIGIYASSLKSVQNQQIQTATANVNRVQHLFAADAALRSALSTYEANNGKNNVSETKTLPNNGGSFVNNITKGSSNAVTSITITYPDGSTQVVSATISKLSPGQYYKSGARKIHKNGYVVSQIFADAVKKPKS